MKENENRKWCFTNFMFKLFSRKSDEEYARAKLRDRINKLDSPDSPRMEVKSGIERARGCQF